MEMVILENQEQLPIKMKNSLIFLIVCFSMCFSCNSHKKDMVVLENNKNLRLDNGILNYNNVPFTGIVKAYYDATNLKFEAYYVNGKKQGVENVWYANGVKLSERYYSNGFKVGKHKGWWENGTLKFEYHFNKDGDYDGTVKEWYESGKLLRNFNYVKGQEVESQRLWNPDGSIKANYIVKDGERFGLIGLKKCYTVTINNNEIH
jgi:antitoxin component YwqK of YwqJK toxin-antitoxin module